MQAEVGVKCVPSMDPPGMNRCYGFMQEHVEQTIKKLILKFDDEISQIICH